jgi:hypothetical protein
MAAAAQPGAAPRAGPVCWPAAGSGEPLELPDGRRGRGRSGPADHGDESGDGHGRARRGAPAGRGGAGPATADRRRPGDQPVGDRARSRPGVGSRGAAGERLLAHAVRNGPEAGEDDHDLGRRRRVAPGAPGVGVARPGGDFGPDLGLVASAVPGAVAEPVAKPGQAVRRLGCLRRRARHHGLPAAQLPAAPLPAAPLPAAQAGTSGRWPRRRSGSRSASPRRLPAAAARAGRSRTRAAPARSRSRRPCQRRGTARARPART